MNTRTKRQVIGSFALSLTVAMVLAGCGSAASPSTTATPPSNASGGAGSASAAPSVVGEKKFAVSLGSLGISTMVAKAAADALKPDGFEIDTPVMTSAELSVEGVSNGQFAFGTSGNSTALLAIEAGGDLQLVVDNIANEWSLYASNDIKECADLNGQPVGIFSEGGVSTAMVRNYFATECPDAKPEYLVLGDSQARAAALVSGQIKGTPVELSDALNLNTTAPDKVHRLASFAESLPDLKTTSFYGNTTFMKANPDSTRAFIRALIEQYRKIDEDPAYLKEITLKYYPGVAQDTLDAATAEYANGHYFPVNGGLNADNLEYTIKFFEDAGVLKPGLSPDRAADLSYMNAVLDEMGKQ